MNMDDICNVSDILYTILYADATSVLLNDKHINKLMDIINNELEKLIILQVNINGLRNKLEELKLLIHDTHEDIITIQETKLTPKAKTPKIHNFTAVCTDRLHKAGGGLITLIRDNITFTTTDIPLTINTQNFKWSRYTLTTLNISQ